MSVSISAQCLFSCRLTSLSLYMLGPSTLLVHVRLCSVQHHILSCDCTSLVVLLNITEMEGCCGLPDTDIGSCHLCGPGTHACNLSIDVGMSAARIQPQVMASAGVKMK